MHPLTRAALIDLARATQPIPEIYIYSADLFCEDCGEEIREALTNEGNAPDDESDENSYDSDEFPKGPFDDGGGEADSVQHCGSHEACLNAITLPSGHKIGAWLGNQLTREGVRYTCEHVQEGGEVAVLWSVWYADELDAAGCEPPKKRVIYYQGRPVLR